MFYNRSGKEGPGHQRNETLLDWSVEAWRRSGEEGKKSTAVPDAGEVVPLTERWGIQKLQEGTLF